MALAGLSNMSPEAQADLSNMSPEALSRFMDFMRNEVENPPKTTDLFKVPADLPKGWQIFFDKVAAHYARQCEDRHALIYLEKRSWILEDEKLTEFEMFMSAIGMKEEGNAAFREGDVARALLFYMSANSTFPTPDVMNNVAACALRENRFQMAEDFASKALDMDLFTNVKNKAKAYFRRAQARMHLGNFEEALQDINIAADLHPDVSISSTRGEIETLIETVKSPSQRKTYLDGQKSPPGMLSFTEGMQGIQDLGMQYVRVPDFVDFKQVQPPSF